MFQVSHESRLQPLKDKAIFPLSLSIGLGVCDGRIIHPGALSRAKASELFRVEVRTIVYYDAMGNSVPKCYFLHEIDGSVRVQLLHRLGFTPFSKLVDFNK